MDLAVLTGTDLLVLIAGRATLLLWGASNVGCGGMQPPVSISSSMPVTMRSVSSSSVTGILIAFFQIFDGHVV